MREAIDMRPKYRKTGSAMKKDYSQLKSRTLLYTPKPVVKICRICPIIHPEAPNAVASVQYYISDVDRVLTARYRRIGFSVGRVVLHHIPNSTTIVPRRHEST